MQDDLSFTFALRGVPSSVCVVDGYGIRLRVLRGHLVVSDGIGRHRRERTFWRGDPGIERLVILGKGGYMTLEATRWVNDVGIPFVQLGTDGRVIATSGIRHLNDSRLRREQALAGESPVGREIARHLLQLKLEGQAGVATRIPESEDTLSQIRESLNVLTGAKSLQEMLLAESQAAAAYWDAWKMVSVRFSRQDSRKVPSYWLSFGQRSSPISSSPRLAANPANALLNYLYALLEAETRIACIATGLDPGIGIVHVDQRSRDSLVLDVMESVRPHVDSYLLDLLENRVFRVRDFTETRTGVCRLLPPLSHLLAQTSPCWAGAVAPIAETLSATLRSGFDGSASQLPTPLTERNRKAGRDRVRRSTRASALAKPDLPPTCRDCGNPLGISERVRCGSCDQVRRRQAKRHVLKGGANASNHGGDAAIRRGNTVADRWREIKAWDSEHQVKPDPRVFRENIWPLIKYLSITRLVTASGLSPHYCQMIRKGTVVPHPRHWPNFAALANTNQRPAR